MLRGIHTGKMFTPQSKEGTIIFPGFDGGAEWGGAAVDPESAMMYVNANQMAWILQMFDVDPAKKQENFEQAGQRLYKAKLHELPWPGKKRKRQLSLNS